MYETYTIFGSDPIFVGIDPVNEFPFTSINSIEKVQFNTNVIYIRRQRKKSFIAKKYVFPK